MWLASSRTFIARGLVTVAFGMLLMLWPGISLEVFTLVFGAFALGEGALILTAAALASRDEPGRTLAFLAGTLGILVGVVSFLWPGLTQLTLLILIAIRVLVVGVAELATAIYIGRHASAWGTGAWLLACVSLLSIAFAALLLVYPAAGLIALVWTVGLYAVLLGLMLITRAWLLTLSSHAVEA